MKITQAEWQDYYTVQQSGVMNMMGHPLIRKFMPRGNWAAAHKHFEEEGNTGDLVVQEEE